MTIYFRAFITKVHCSSTTTCRFSSLNAKLYCRVIIVHWCYSGPDVPQLMSITEVQQTNVTLTWDLGATNVKNSSVVHYVDVTSTSSWHTTNNINRLTGLTPGHTYVFYLEVQSFEKTEGSRNYTVTAGELIISFALGFDEKIGFEYLATEVFDY